MGMTFIVAVVVIVRVTCDDWQPLHADTVFVDDFAA